MTYWVYCMSGFKRIKVEEGQVSTHVYLTIQTKTGRGWINRDNLTVRKADFGFRVQHQLQGR